MTRHVRFCTNILLAAAISWLSSQGFAVTTNWIATTGQFTDPANWDNGVPDGDDTAVFNRGVGVAYHVAFPGGFIFDPPLNYVIDSLRVRSNEITLRDVSSPDTTRPSLIVGNPDLSIVVGQDAGEVAVLNTSLINLSGARTSIGRAAGAEGTLNVVAGRYSMSGLDVGDSGTGTLNVTGGRVESSGTLGRFAGSEGRANIAGSGSSWVMGSSIFRVGSEGMGELNITEGGMVSNRFAIIAERAGSTGRVLVGGAGSTWSIMESILGVGFLGVGSGGAGVLTIEAGGSVFAGEARLGEFGGSTGSATVRGAGSRLTISGRLVVGGSANGALAIEDGAAVSNDETRISVGETSRGAVTVSGAGSTWTTGSMSLGEQSPATLTIQNGGAVSNSSARIENDSTITVQGPGSTWTTGDLAAVSSATLTIQNGAAVSSTGALLDVNNATMIVRGTGASWTNNGPLFLGYFGSAKITIEDGGSVSTTEAILGNQHVEEFRADGTVTVSGTDGSGNASTWTNSSQLIIGNAATGVLQVRGGGGVFSSNAIVASLSGSDGAVTVTGAGSTWTNNGNLTVGDLGTGTLTIADGGEVVVTGNLSANATSRVRLEGGKLTINQFGSAGLDAFDWRSGTLRLTGTSGLTIGSTGLFGASLALDAGKNLEVDNTLTIDSGAELFASGGLSAGSLINNGELVLSSTTVNGPVTNAAGANITAIGNVTFNDLASGTGGFFGPGSVTFNGGMSPGASAASVSFESDVVLTSNNTLQIELGGTDEFDSLQIGGAAMLGGELDVSLIDGFSPALGNSFEILHADGGIFGAFSDVTLPGLAAGLELDVVYSNFAVLLQVAAAGIPGDYNQNGIVDAADYVVWRKHLGSGASLPNDDSPGVGPDDYTRWRAHFGETVAANAATSAIPEPTGLMIALLAISVLPVARRRASMKGTPISATSASRHLIDVVLPLHNTPSNGGSNK